MSKKLVEKRKTGPAGPNHILLKYLPNPIFINSSEQFLKIKQEYQRNQKIQFKCPRCKNIRIKQVRTIETLVFFCAKCNNSIGASKRIESVKKTKLEKYGNATYNNQEKRKSTIKQKYGSFNIIAEKSAAARKRNLELHPELNEIFNKRRKSTILKNFGTWENYIQNSSEKSKKTKLKKYGNATYNNQTKRWKTLLKNGSSIYGHKYLYENIYFDSSWELLFWIYHQDNSSNIERNNSFFFNYKDNNGKEHKYFPDFKLNNQWIEIKGSQFFNKEGNAIKSFEGEDWTSKYQCIIDNNVKLIFGEDLKDIFKYCAEKISKGSMKNLWRWCKQFALY